VDGRSCGRSEQEDEGAEVSEGEPMNPIIVVALIGGIALIVQALVNAYSAKKKSEADEKIAKELAETKVEMAATKHEVKELSSRVDGRLEQLMDAIRRESIQIGRDEQKAEITEEAVRVAGVGIEAAKRAG
jgi:hypothetical protein